MRNVVNNTKKQQSRKVVSVVLIHGDGLQKKKKKKKKNVNQKEEFPLFLSRLGVPMGVILGREVIQLQLLAEQQTIVGLQCDWAAAASTTALTLRIETHVHLKIKNKT